MDKYVCPAFSNDEPIDVSEDFKNATEFGVAYGSRTRVATVKEMRITVIQRNFAAWIALCRN